MPSILLDTFAAFSYSETLHEIIKSLALNRSLIQTRLEPPLLLPTEWNIPLLEKRVVRANTALVYKQKRFNLLREESEGYAKLIVEIHSASYSPNKMALVKRTANIIVSLIGYFDLDPNRALDIFLDIYSTNIVAHAQFFLEVLKMSPWWPTVPSNATNLSEIGKGGNYLAASLIGFKLQWYRKLEETAPENLMAMIAVLIKEGFICLGDLYPHLSPSDEELLQEKDAWSKKLEQTAYLSTASALALAMPLDDDGPRDRSSKPKEKEKEKESEKQKEKKSVTPQKPQLAAALLSVGSIWPAMFILAKFPFLPGPYSEIADNLNILMAHALTPFYESIRPFKSFLDQTKNVKKLPARQRGASAHGRAGFTLMAPNAVASRRVLSHLKRSEKADTTYRIFYDSWTDGVKMIENIEDFILYSDYFLKFTGPQLSRDPVLFTKLCRIVNHFLTESKKEKDLTTNSYDSAFWLQYFRTYLLPAVSLIEENPGVLYEVAAILFHFDYSTRYSVYGEWYNVLLRNVPQLRVAGSKAEKETKNVLKRLAKENVREMMRLLARVSYANPITSLTALVSQVESYDNLSSLVVEAARYFTAIGWDALPLVIMMQLSSGRNTVQGDGITERKWLQCKLLLYVLVLQERFR